MSGSLFGPTSPKGGGAGSGGGSALTIQDEGVTIDANTDLIDFIGDGVTASSAGAGLVDVTIPGTTSQGFWAGRVLAASFSGTPPKATVAFGSPHPSGTDYSIAVDEIVVLNSGYSIDLSIEDKTANGFTIVLGAAVTADLIAVDWQVQPHGVATGPAGIISLPGIQNILIVDKGTNATEDGTQQFPYHTIAAAMAAASSGDVVLVYPGTYTEQVSPEDGVRLRGVDQARCIIENTGASGATQPLATASGTVAFDIQRMTIRTSVSGGTLWQLGGSPGTTLWSFFKDCTFDNGRITEASGGAIALADFTDCMFINDTLAFSLTGAQSAASFVTFDGCRIQGSPTFTSTHSSSISRVTYTESMFTSTGNFVFGGDWSFDAYLGVIGFGQGLSWDSDQTLSISESDINGAIAITTAPSFTSIVNNVFSFFPGGNPDITSTVTVTGVTYANNTQNNGIAGEIQTTDDIKRVGGPTDSYFSLQDALDSVSSNGQTVSVLEDVTLAAALTMPSSRVTIDGNGKHTITGAAPLPIADITASQDVSFRNINLVGDLQVSGNGADLEYEHNVSQTGRVNITGGDASTRVDIIDSTVTGDSTNRHAIRIADADPEIFVTDSLIDGDANAAGYAVFWDSGVTNNNLAAKFSTLTHGLGAANNPFGRDAAQTPTYRSHHDAFNSDPESGGFWTNLIAPGQRFDTLDAQAIY